MRLCGPVNKKSVGKVEVRDTFQILLSIIIMYFIFLVAACLAQDAVDDAIPDQFKNLMGSLDTPPPIQNGGFKHYKFNPGGNKDDLALNDAEDPLKNIDLDFKNGKSN